MSNCIDFHSGKLIVVTNQAFWDKLSEVKGLPTAPDWGEDGPGHNFWWFVPRDLQPSKVIAFRPGDGRSGHTWRDFRGMLLTMQKMGCSVAGDFICTDESDGHECFFDLSTAVALRD